MFEPGQAVRGAIDWVRRFDHMQQHTGQHILSAAIVHRWQVPTVSFHLGKETATIDLARELTPEQVAAAEDDANRIVWEDGPVTVRYVDAGDAATLGLRKASSRTGTLRLVNVGEFDLSARAARTWRARAASGSSWYAAASDSRADSGSSSSAAGGRSLRRDSSAIP